MPTPPSKYPNEVNNASLPCGSTWRQAITVDGRLPNGYGADLRVELPPVLGELGYGVGRDELAERSARQKLEARIKSIRAMLGATQRELKPRQIHAVKYLLAGAQQELDAARAIHALWGRLGWPLKFGDTLASFPKLGERCAGNRGKYLTPSGGGRKVYCPTEAEQGRRPFDRQQIRRHFENAATWVRCAEFGFTRQLLYQRALKRYQTTAPTRELGATPGGGGGGGSPAGPGGLAAPRRPVEPPPPPQPPDFPELGPGGPSVPPKPPAPPPIPAPTKPSPGTDGDTGGSPTPPPSRSSSSVAPKVTAQQVGYTVLGLGLLAVLATR